MKLDLGRITIGVSEPVPLPRMVPVRQKFETRRIHPDEIDGIVADQFNRDDVGPKIKPGMRIAVGVGSRGIENIARIVRATVHELKQRGAVPFLVPAMGSHGGATLEGQIKVLAEYGITEEYVGAPIRSSMDTVHLGEVLDGVEVHFDKTAYEQADGILVVARIKPHTDFKARIESGILKMLSIGLGKHKGASYLHKFGMDRFGTLLPVVGKFIIDRTPIPGGVAIIEDAYHSTAAIEVVPSEKLDAQHQRFGPPGERNQRGEYVQKGTLHWPFSESRHAAGAGHS